MSPTLLLRISSVLWVIWGLVHAFAGIMTLSSSTTGAIQAIADAVDPATLVMDYPAAAGAILDQHSWNLLWAGVVTTIGGILIWRQNITAIWVTAMIGILFDIGYFVFLDLGGFVHFFPGTLMTIFSASAFILSFWAWSQIRKSGGTA